MPPGGLFEGLVGSEYTLIIRSPSYAVFKQALGDLGPGEIRDVRASMVSGGCMAGSVVRAATRAPVSGIYLGLYAAAAVEDGPESPFIGAKEYSSHARRSRRERRSIQTDAEGCFRFESVPAGEYVVRAVAGPGAEAVAAGLLIVSNERHDNLELVLPDASALFGRL
ncbi:MAG: carboxypeptidase regulatory-like domain-containing protein, partial [bacterium]|nr:carboxypeptidase regulatory-like domain-containing protein [bacterium]